MSDENTPVETPETEAASEAAETTEEFVSLLPGRALRGPEAANITRARATRLVILAGPVESGKTTLVASIYDRFQRGPFGAIRFAGSLTLPAFEERCRLARAATGGSVPETPRTPKEEAFHFLHLRLKVTDASRPVQEVLIADITGEAFQLAKDSAAECRRLTLLRHADTVVLLVDGAELTAPALRHQCIDDTRRLLRRLVEEEMIGLHTHLQVVYSKWDLVEHADEPELATTLQGFESYLSDTVAPAVGRLVIRKIAASPAKKPEWHVGWGIEKLLELWLNPHVRPPPFMQRAPEIGPHSSRDYFAFDCARSLQVDLWGIEP